MDGVNLNSSVKQTSRVGGYDSSKVVNVTDKLKKTIDASQYDVGTFKPVTGNYYGLKTKVDPKSMAMRTQSPEGQASQKLIADTKAAVNRYFDGDISLEELQSEYRALVERHVDTAVGTSLLPSPSTQMKQCAAEGVHDLFRETVLETAVQRNNAEGRQYASEGMGYKYYNADYYYESEKVLAALTETAKEYGADNGFEFGSLDTAPKLSVVGDDRYDNFNTAWSTNMTGNRSHYMIDTDKAPPEGFKWFYEDPSLPTKPGEGKMTLISVTTELPSGEKVTEYFNQARTWVSWAEDGVTEDQWHKVEADFPYGWNQEDLETVAALIKFSTGNPEVDSILNSYLENLCFYPKSSFGGINTQA